MAEMTLEQQRALALAAARMRASQAQQPEDTGIVGDLKQGLGNLAAGAVRGAGSIGATILAPVDAAANAMGIHNSFIGRNDRRAAMDAGLKDMGADPNSILYKTGKLGTEVAGTAGVGGALANGARAIPLLARAVPNLATALASGGFRVAQPAVTTAGKVGNALLRTGAGAAVGGATAGLINPEDAGTGAVLGGVMPGAVKVAGDAGTLISDKVIKPAARRLMQSAIKPTIKQLKTGDAQVAIDTLLKYGINPSQSGVEKLRSIIDDINSTIQSKVANSGATVNRNDVLGYLGDVRGKFGNQVSPTADLNAIGGVADDFMNHPGITGNNIPVQQAQQLKTGTYKALAGKYGEVGSAATEAQKALARGLKDKIAEAVPGISPLNAEEARLIKTLGVTERRALMELNKNPVGLSALAGNPVGFAAFMADRSAAFKALAARMINRSAAAPASIGLLSNRLENPLLRNAGLLAVQSNP